MLTNKKPKYFMKADYMGVHFCRVMELGKQDLFMINGVWRQVTKVTKKEIHYKNVSDKKNGKTLSIKSQQYVEVIRAKEPSTA
jgi:hypothetical protein